MLISIGSTSCRTSISETDTEARQLIVSMLPEAPVFPVFPSLSWTYKDGLYGLSETDVDLLLDYVENSLAEFLFDYTAWKSQVDIVLESLI